MSAPLSPLALERNLALFAGAGSGKTHGLITLCLHLLAGARQEGTPLPPSRLWLVTFTEKAAGEMRERLRQRVAALSRKEGHEPELEESFERLGRPLPDAGFWRQVLDGLSGATVTTFHSACVQILRRAPAGAGVSPDFELLDERASQTLLRDCAERMVLEALAEREVGVVALCRDLEFGTEGREGLTGALIEVYGKLREEGLRPDQLPLTEPEEAIRAFDEARRELIQAVSEASALDLAAKGRFAPFLTHCAEVLQGLGRDNFWAPDGFPSLVRAAKETDLRGPRGELAAALKRVKYAIKENKDGPLTLDAFHAAMEAAGHERAFGGLLTRLAARHKDALRRRNTLDFAGLLIEARDLLAQDVHFRRELQTRIGALLVDEFQDTNRIQLELVTLLAERREDGPRVLGPEGPAALPLEPAFLCAVGDRKQSIYEFRGADVSVFEALAEKIVAEGGVREALRKSWRSVPGLVKSTNALFAQVMAPPADAKDYEVAFSPDFDALDPVRPGSQAGCPIEVLAQEPAEKSEACRMEEAAGLARHLADLLASKAPLVGERDGSLRPARGGDVAILLRSFSALEIYRQALMREGVPHRVVRGRGFFGAQEVLDLASLLSLLSDPSDGLSLAAVLRSPLVGLSDDSIVLLGTGGRSFTVFSVSGSADRERLPAEELARLDRFLETFGRLRAAHRRVGAHALLQLALEALPFREALAAAPFGEQALANVDKLLSQAQAWDRTSPGDLDGFAQSLRALAATEPREAQADAFDLDDPRAVQILTVHQSKGLEWPIVVVPNLAAKSPNWSQPWFFDRTLGFGLKVRLPDGSLAHTPRTQRLSAERRRREAAELRRVLYVALTRARDRLVLSGRSPQEGNTWRAWVAPWISEAEAAGTLRRVDPAKLPPRQEAMALSAPGAGTEQVRAAMHRVRERPPAPVEELVLPVTQLERFAQCPRRYWLTHELGVSEPALHPFGARGSEGRSVAQRRGSLVHALLEKVPLGAPQAERAEALRRLVSSEGVDPDAAEASEVISWVERFLASDWGRRLEEAGEGRVHRELPFVLRIPLEEGAALCLKGQMDLLVETEEGVVVLDYKSARDDSKEEAYAFQLGCYALAAEAWSRPGQTVRAGVLYLRTGAAPRLRTYGDLDEVRGRLQALGRSLLDAVRTDGWQGRPREICRAVECGYVQRCHPNGAAL